MSDDAATSEKLLTAGLIIVFGLLYAPFTGFMIAVALSAVTVLVVNLIYWMLRSRLEDDVDVTDVYALGGDSHD